MIRNNRTKAEGELLVRRMSDKAQQYYNENEGPVIYADSRTDNEGIEVSYDNGRTFATVSFRELEADFEEMQREHDEMED